MSRQQTPKVVLPHMAAIGILALLSLCTPATCVHAGTMTFTNSNPITIPDVSIGSPYPSPIMVSGLSGTITDMTVTLHGLSHTFPPDIGVLLVGPGGQSVALMDNAGSDPISNITYTFDDTAADFLPFIGAPPSGTYKPTVYDSNANITNQFDTFAPPAPGSNYSGIGLAIFNGTVPNGTYDLFVQDFVLYNTGTLQGGWSLTIAAVPEPSTLVLLTTGLGGILGYGWRQRKKGRKSDTTRITHGHPSGWPFLFCGALQREVPAL